MNENKETSQTRSRKAPRRYTMKWLDGEKEKFKHKLILKDNPIENSQTVLPDLVHRFSVSPSPIPITTALLSSVTNV